MNRASLKILIKPILDRRNLISSRKYKFPFDREKKESSRDLAERKRLIQTVSINRRRAGSTFHARCIIRPGILDPRLKIIRGSSRRVASRRAVSQAGCAARRSLIAGDDGKSGRCNRSAPDGTECRHGNWHGTARARAVIIGAVVIARRVAVPV